MKFPYVTLYTCFQYLELRFQSKAAKLTADIILIIQLVSWLLTSK